MMSNSIEQGGSHFGVTEYTDPFSEIQVGGDEKTGFFIQLTDQVKQECATGFGERDVTQFINDDAISHSFMGYVSTGTRYFLQRAELSSRPNNALAIDSTGEGLVSANDDHTIRFWDLSADDLH